MKSSTKKLVVWRKNGKSTKKHLCELQGSYMEEHWERVSRSSNQGWWTNKVAEAICEKKEAWKELEKTKGRGNQLDARMIHTYGQKKKAAKKAVNKVRRDMEADVYSKLNEDGGKKMIYKMARDRDENSKDVKGGTVIKDRNGKLVTEQEAVLKVWESYFKELFERRSETFINSTYFRFSMFYQLTYHVCQIIYVFSCSDPGCYFRFIGLLVQ